MSTAQRFFSAGVTPDSFGKERRGLWVRSAGEDRARHRTVKVTSFAPALQKKTSC